MTPGEIDRLREALKTSPVIYINSAGIVHKILRVQDQYNAERSGLFPVAVSELFAICLGQVPLSNFYAAMPIPAISAPNLPIRIDPV